MEIATQWLTSSFAASSNSFTLAGQLIRKPHQPLSLLMCIFPNAGWSKLKVHCHICTLVSGFGYMVHSIKTCCSNRCDIPSLRSNSKWNKWSPTTTKMCHALCMKEDERRRALVKVANRTHWQWPQWWWFYGYPPWNGWTQVKFVPSCLCNLGWIKGCG